MPTQPVKLFAPADFPQKQAEIRAYTVAAFRIASVASVASVGGGGGDLSLLDMPKKIVDFLIKGRALDYWKKQQWLQATPTSYRLTEAGLEICRKADGVASAGAADAGWWEGQFVANTQWPRYKTFRFPLPEAPAADRQ